MSKRQTAEGDTAASVTQQLDRIAQQIQRIRREYAPIKPAGKEERVLALVSEGRATIRHGVDGRTFFIVRGELYGLDGSHEGIHEAVYEAKVFSTHDLLDTPDPPQWPFDRPSRPDEPEWAPLLNPTKSRWVLGSGHELRAVGPALSRVALMPGGGMQFWYGATSFVTGGRGDYDGAIGQATSLGSSYFNEVPKLNEADEFAVNLVHIIKLILGHSRSVAD